MFPNDLWERIVLQAAQIRVCTNAKEELWVMLVMMLQSHMALIRIIHVNTNSTYTNVWDNNTDNWMTHTLCKFGEVIINTLSLEVYNKHIRGPTHGGNAAGTTTINSTSTTSTQIVCLMEAHSIIDKWQLTSTTQRHINTWHIWQQQWQVLALWRILT